MLQAPNRIDRELFELDIRRVLRVGWLILATSTAASILSLTGERKEWQWQATLIILVVACICIAIDVFSKSIWAYLLMPITLLVLPIIYASSSSEPWIAYGLIVIPAVLHTTITNDYRIAIVIIYCLTLLQYTVSKLELKSLTDNVDNQLLSSYFSTSWTLIVGVGAIIIRRAYLNYYDAIEDSVKKIIELEIDESKKIKELNQRDHLNSQLHGTVLNTLIALKNSPKLLEDQKEMARFLSKDLLTLENARPEIWLELEHLTEDDSNSPIHRPLEIDFHTNIGEELEPLIYEVIKELLRELILNVKKHTNATNCTIEIDILQTPLTGSMTTSVTERVISIKMTDNSPFMDQIEKHTESIGFVSDSISRILKRVNGEVVQSNDTSTLTQIITFTYPESPDTYLGHIKTLRRESIKYLSKGYILLSLFYSVVTLPAFLYIGIDRSVASLYFLQIILISSSFVFKGLELQLSALGSLVAILIFPLLATKQPLLCQELQYLPWIFNSLLGSVFYVTLITKSKWFKWLPILLFLIANLNIQSKLPTACEKILDGSIPGIILIAVISFGFAVARKRSNRREQNFIAKSVGIFTSIASTNSQVSVERQRVIDQLKAFVHQIETQELEPLVLQKKIENLILKLRSFLLTSEYFHSPLILEIYRYSVLRNDKDLKTILEITTSDFETAVSRREIERIFKQIDKLTEGLPVKVQISRMDDIHVDIWVDTARSITPTVIRKGDLRVQLLSDTQSPSL